MHRSITGRGLVLALHAMALASVACSPVVLEPDTTSDIHADAKEADAVPEPGVDVGGTDAGAGGEDAQYWYGTDIPIGPTGPVPSSHHFCAAGGRYDASGDVTGWSCLGPGPLSVGPASGGGVLWLPGPIFHVAP